MHYFIQNGDDRSGPYLPDELRNLPITRDTLVWHSGLYQWTRACEVLELVDLFEPPRPGQKTVTELLGDFRPVNA